jgi:hypothetical protein
MRLRSKSVAGYAHIYIVDPTGTSSNSTAKRWIDYYHT